MKNFFLLSAIVLLFCGCNHAIPVTDTPPEGSVVVPLIELSIPGKLESFLNSPAEKIIFSADTGFAGELPVPQDFFMSLLQHQDLPPVRFTVVAGGQSGIVSLWNNYAAKLIFSGKSFDRKAARRTFLQKHFGKAAPQMLEYFRILERHIIANGALAGIGYPSYPDARMICEDGFFDRLEAILNMAEKAADSDSARQLVAAEKALVAESRRKLQQNIADNWPTAVANSGKVSSFFTHYGDRADIQTTLQLECDENCFILTLTAGEPELTKRVSQNRPRDFVNMWAEDGFEIFIVPDPDDLDNCLQFIINSHGSLWDASCDVNGLRNTAWSAANAKVEFSELDRAWRVKLTIPWRDLGFSGIPAKPFPVNVYRNRIVRGMPHKIYAWSPVGSGAFYQPERFGLFVWKDGEK